MAIRKLLERVLLQLSLVDLASETCSSFYFSGKVVTIMFQLLKRIFLFIYLVFVRSTKRARLIKVLTSKSGKKKIDIDSIPAAFDEVVRLPERWSGSVSFVGFDSKGICARLQAQKTHKGQETLQIDLDIPGYGHFNQNEVVPCRIDHANYTRHLFTGRRIKLICLSPMKRWKVYFRGPLKHMNTNGKLMHATVSLYWHCFFDPYDHLFSPSCWKLADTFSALKWKDILNFSAFESIVSYEQWGELRGRINIETYEEISVRLKCVREMTFRHENSNNFQQVSHQTFIAKESGLSFSNQAMKLGNTLVESGYVSFPIGDNISTRLVNTSKSKTHRFKTFTQSISAGDMCYHVTETLSRTCFSDDSSDFKFTTLSINGKSAIGLHFSFNVSPIASEVEVGDTKPIESIYNNNTEVVFMGEHPEVINLGTPACSLKSLVGGKAYHLSVLKSDFNIPNGFCVTTLAFKKHIQFHNKLQSSTQKVKECLRYLSAETLKQTCDDAERSLQQMPLNSDLQSLVQKHLNEVFGTDLWRNKRFAVRSSSVSEDDPETSTAGQLDTYLCVQGFDNLISAIQHCWASSVAYRVVEYRRQNGQELLENVGVVVQEMVDADVAGILFTVDPVTGNESNMIINANYGLGESVVSGTVNPDTIVVSRGDNGKLQIKCIHIGAKETRRVAYDENGTSRETVSSSDTRILCINEADVLRIAEQGIEIEKYFDSPQDIEWAIQEGQIYILQARPVSVLDSEGDEELLCEFDTPVVSEKELITPCNIEEMMPGATTPLTGDIFVYGVGRAGVCYVHRRLGIQPPVHALVGALTFSGHSFLNITYWALKDISGFGGDKAKANIEVSVFGQPVNEHTVDDIKDFYGRRISYQSKLRQTFREYLLDKSDLKLYETLVDTIEATSFCKHTETAQMLFEWIDENIILYFEMWKFYVFKLTGSLRQYGAIMRTLKGKAKELSVEHMADMALILSKCRNVISAEIPCFVHDLAKRIAKSDTKEQFLNLSPEECDSFLKNSGDDRLKSDYISFMERHGHRGVRESELIDKSWSQNPSQFMQTIQFLVRKGLFPESETKARSVKEIVEGLQTNLSRFQKMMLKLFFVQNAMKEVGIRELAKSNLIKVTHIFRQAYWKLADLMVSESRLPEPELLFFLTHREIGELIKFRCVKLVRLSKRRKSLFPEMNKFSYSKINIGRPKPLQDAKSNYQNLTTISLQGMPVCRGKAEGRACVIESLDDADRISQGDILVCKFTDVGWSPFYPLISGLATEMGGLMSHGAIIAREYGIPCVVNITGVTDMIQTGDRVILDGAAGTITK